MSKLRTVSRVLDLRERKKEEIENEVRQIRSKIRELEKMLDELEAKFSSTTSEFEKKQNSREIDVHSLELYYNYFLNLHEEMNSRKTEIISKLTELNERQNALIEAYKDKKLFEILHSRILKEEAEQKDKADQKEQDYLHLARKLRHK
jgi:flagellar export protein FliJ